MIRGHMLGKTMLPSDEEMGKKDDDHQYVPARRSGWSIWNHAFRWRRRRVLLAVVGMAVVYFVFWSTGEAVGGLDDTPQDPRVRSTTPGTYDPFQRPGSDGEPTGPPEGIPKPRHGDAIPLTYDGPIKFYRLGSTLRAQASMTDGFARQNRNVVFVVSSLKSASALLPMICEMAYWKRNHVHAVFMGREDISWEGLWEVNGIDTEQCPAVWHDARPDYAQYSTDVRAGLAVAGALTHVQKYLHPQVAITDGSVSEDGFFSQGMRSEIQRLGIPLIEIPKDKMEEVTWITQLDAGSLSMWDKATVDILIQVPPDSSSVLRLLETLMEADYSSLQPPRITLELPAELDASVKQHLQYFIWPPYQSRPCTGSGLTIRRRVTNHRATQEESATRFLELFYPTSTSHSHVLLLSPQAHLSPQYFHYVKYALLEYKYSMYSENDHSHLMGISLEPPSVLLDGTTELALPTTSDMHTSRYTKLFPTTKSAPFLWQAPNSHATVFFGDKWAEFHSFLGNRVVKHQQSANSTSRPKLVSETLPSWTEYMLEFMRARSYSLLYPAMTSSALVTIHNELYHTPEEFTPRPLQRAGPLVPPETPDEPFLRAEATPQAPKNREVHVIPGSVPLHMALPFKGDLPELPDLPQLLYNGTMVPPMNASSIARDFANKFREEIGGCTVPEGKRKKRVPGEAGDLFCFGDEDEDDWEEDVRDEPVRFDVSVDDGFESVGEDEVDTSLGAATATATGQKTVAMPSVAPNRLGLKDTPFSKSAT